MRLRDGHVFDSFTRTNNVNRIVFVFGAQIMTFSLLSPSSSFSILSNRILSRARTRFSCAYTQRHEPRQIMTTLSCYLDAPSTPSKKTNNFYLIHHQSSLIPIKDLLNENLNSNIEIIQMDEQECILEIVDGVLTLVPKDKSTSSTSASELDRKNAGDYHAATNHRGE